MGGTHTHTHTHTLSHTYSHTHMTEDTSGRFRGVRSGVCVWWVKGQRGVCGGRDDGTA